MPIGIGAAIAGAAVVGAGASIVGSSSASNTAATTAANNNALQQSIYNSNVAALSPYETQGAPAGKSIDALLGLSGDPTAANAAFDAYKGSTEYQSRLTQGQNSVTAALGSKGLLDSGAGQKALLNYGQTAASNEFGQYLGNLQDQQKIGLTAASAQAGVGQGYANAVTASNNAASTTSSNAALSQAGAINGALGNIVTGYGYNQALNSSYGNGTSNSSGSNTLGYDPSYDYGQGG